MAGIKIWRLFPSLRRPALALALAAALTIGAVPLMAQNAPDNFQFNELDFDRQGGGAAPAPQYQGSGDPDAGLSDLFSGDPAENQAQPQAPAQAQSQPPAQAQGGPEAGRYQNLPGETSPVTVPSASGEAKIELAGTKAGKGAGQARSRRSAREPEFRNFQERRFYYAMQAWLSHPELSRVNCRSYLTSRPLYPVKCLGDLAKRLPAY